MRRPQQPKGLPVSLESKQFMLRTLGTEDVTEEYVSWWNDPQVQVFLGFQPRGWDRERATRHVQSFDNRRSFHFGIFTRSDGRMIGFITLRMRTDDYATTAIVIGDKGQWGKKVPLEVRSAVFDYAFDKLGVNKIAGEVEARNFPSIFNYKAQGFTCEGILREHLKLPDGSRSDMLVFGLLKREWDAIRATNAEAENG